MQTSSSAPLCLNHPDITAMADWACKTNYQFVCQSVFYLYGWMDLSIYLSVSLSVCCTSIYPSIHLSLYLLSSLFLAKDLIKKCSCPLNLFPPTVHSSVVVFPSAGNFFSPSLAAARDNTDVRMLSFSASCHRECFFVDVHIHTVCLP